jgi:elongation factor Ts
LTVAEKLIEQTGLLNKSVLLKKLSGEFVGSYIHAGNKIATIVALSANVDQTEELQETLSMQAAAMNQLF